jgi:hypothetical protein
MVSTRNRAGNKEGLLICHSQRIECSRNRVGPQPEKKVAGFGRREHQKSPPLNSIFLAVQRSKFPAENRYTSQEAIKSEYSIIYYCLLISCW